MEYCFNGLEDIDVYFYVNGNVRDLFEDLDLEYSSLCSWCPLTLDDYPLYHHGFDTWD